MQKTLRFRGPAAVLLWVVAGAVHAQAYVNATVGGELAPGVYGQIQIGNAPPPPLLYSRPVVIHRPAVVVPAEPMYLYVPPGHAKNWRKHCARYDACGRPVYFVKEPPRRGDSHGQGRRHDNDHDNGHGKGKGHGKHRD